MSFSTTAIEIVCNIAAFETTVCDRNRCIRSDNMPRHIFAMKLFVLRKIPDQFDTGKIHLSGAYRFRTFDCFQTMRIIKQMCLFLISSKKVCKKTALAVIRCDKDRFFPIARTDKRIAATDRERITLFYINNMIGFY